MKTEGVQYLIEGREWFDKLNGNSYHQVNITSIKGNKIIVSTEMEYGYGNQYEQTGYDELIKLKIVKEKDRFNHVLNGKRFIYRIKKNCLKRELQTLEVQK